MHHIILLSGRRCSGKTYFSKILSDNFDIVHFEMSAIAKSIRHIENKSSMRLRHFVENKFIESGKHFIIQHLNIYTIKKLKSHCIISGIRHVDEIEYLKSHYSPKQIHTFFLYDSFLNRLFKTYKREERNSVLDFLIEEYYSFKWNTDKIQEMSIVIDKRKMNSESIIDLFSNYITNNILS